MNRILVLSLIALFGACEDSENQVKDMRDHNIEVDDEFIPEVEEETTREAKATIKEKPAETDEPSSEWSYKVTELSADNWGYQIFQKGKMIINQTSIPSVQGTSGFDSEAKAERTAKHIINKVENGIFPPTVNKEELEDLGVLRD